MWIRADAENAAKVHRALDAFGAPLANLTPLDLAVPDVVFQIGVAPNRIDILTVVSGLTFEEAWPARVKSRYGDQAIAVLSREHLIQNKVASGRLQDLADVERLRGDLK